MKNIVLMWFIGALLALQIAGRASPPNDKFRVNTVVIDPGHGGKDPGALGNSISREKDIALKVGLKLGQYIKENFPEVNVVYTREKDVFVELHERASIANQAKADLFISIHCNSSPAPSAYGTEVYVLGLHKSEDNLAVAKKENSVILMEDDYVDHYEGFDPNSSEGYILFSLVQNAHLNQSIEVASILDEQFENHVHRKSRGVHQAGFMVLYKTSMPSILVELGFLSNKNEEAFLMSEDGSVYMASAIYRAFKEYKMKVESTIPEEGIIVKKEEPAPVREDNTPVYKVQFLTMTTKVEKLGSKFKMIESFETEDSGANFFRYLTGNFRDYKQAVKYQNELKAKGIKDAFVVAYKNGKRVSIKEARQ